MPLSPLEALEESQQNARFVLDREPDNLLMKAQLGYIQKDLANLHYQNGSKSEGDEALRSAEQTFETVLASDAFDASAHNGLGNVYAMRGDYDAAIREYKIATSLAPEYTYSWYDMALSVQQKIITESEFSEQSLRDLTTAVITALKLHVSEDHSPQKLPPGALSALFGIKDWIVKLADAAAE